MMGNQDRVQSLAVNNETPERISNSVAALSIEFLHFEGSPFLTCQKGRVVGKLILQNVK
jgi:hypothetical protein